MNNIEIATQLSLLISLCFSFSIFLFAVFFNKEDPFIKLAGSAFLIPFSIGSSSFLFFNISYINTSLTMSELGLMTILLLMNVIRPANYSPKILQHVITTAAPILFLAMPFSGLPYKGFMLANTFRLPLLAVILANMYILQKAKENKNMEFWSSSCLLGYNILSFFEEYRLASYSGILLKTGFYACFTYYIFQQTYGRMLFRIKSAEEKISAMDKSLHLEVKKRTFEIERTNEQLVNKSKTDAMTKTLNKTAILEVIDTLASSRRFAEFCILMFDIDNFKTINDTLGHIVGDKCIQKAAVIARTSIRKEDSLGRYGGDEFVMVFPEFTIGQARLTAERFRKKIEETESPQFTVSIGLASFPKDGLSASELIAAADEGLYRSKQKGRNAVSYRNIF